MSDQQSARDRLFAAIEEPGIYNDPRDIHDLIDDFAHELAEQIRAAVATDDDYELRAEEYGVNTNVLHAADLIDPKVNR